MKNRITLILLGLLASFAGHTITIRTAIDLGRKSKGSEGAGICAVKTTGEGNASLTLSEDGTTLTLQMDAALLFENSGQIKDGRFVQEEDYVLPEAVCRALGTSVLLTIPAGRYPTTGAGRERIILFPLAESLPVGLR